MSFFDKSELTFAYNKDNDLTYEEFVKNKNETFDKTSKAEVYFMIVEVCKIRHIDDLYGVKKLEVCIHVDLPSFAYSKKLAKDWLVNNFQY